MSAQVIELSQFRQVEEKSEYQMLRELMVSLFGPLDHVPVEEPAFDGNVETYREVLNK